MDSKKPENGEGGLFRPHKPPGPPPAAESRREAGPPQDQRLHMEGLLRRFTAEPLGPDPRVSLEKIYLSPGALVRENLPHGRLKGPVPVEDLIAALLASLDGKGFPLLLLAAPPGRGKTAAALALAQSMIRAGPGQEWGFLFYAFDELGNLCRDELSVLMEKTPFLRDESFFFKKKNLVIIDGIGGAAGRKQGREALIDFIRNLCLLAKRINAREDGSALRLLLTGRPPFPAALEPVLEPPYAIHEIRELAPERRGRWLEKRGRALPEEALGEKDLNRLGLAGFLDEPGPLLLCARMASEDGKAQGPRSRRQGLQALIRFSCRRQRRSGKSPAEENGEACLEILRAAAFVLLREGVEEMPEERLREKIAECGSRQPLFFREARTPSGALCLPGVTIVSGGGFCFAHRAFREILAAEALFLLLAQAASLYRPEYPERSCRRMAEEVYHALGAVPSGDGGLLSHAREICREEGRLLKESLPGLGKFFSLCRERPFAFFPANGDTPYPLRSEANVQAGLLMFLAEGARQNGSGRPFFSEASELFSLLSLHAAAYPPPGPGPCLDLSELCLAGCFLERSDLRRVNLEGADLSCARLAGADLREARLGRARLSGADLSGARLAGADLRWANLQDTDLKRADLEGAILP